MASLARAEVRYVTVGRLACALNGFVRATEYVDILIQRTPENVRRLLDVLALRQILEERNPSGGSGAV